MNHNFYDYVYATLHVVWLDCALASLASPRSLPVGTLFSSFQAQIAVVIVAIVLLHTHTQREKSYYYFNNLQLFSALRCERRRGANVEGRVIQKQFVEIKFDYIYRPASTSTLLPRTQHPLQRLLLSRRLHSQLSLAKFFDAWARSAL